MIELYLALGVFDALLLAVFIHIPGYWAYKALFILGALVVNFALLAAVPEVDGYATGRPLPEQAEMLACKVVEPEAVYFWLSVYERPRAYRVEYSRDAHAACDAGSQATQRGVRVGLKIAKRDNNPANGVRTSRTKYIPYKLPRTGVPKQ